ncbi:MAG: IclR family transcriptional regulator C-terminal domain-containing protein [Mycobacterium sp.]
MAVQQDDPESVTASGDYVQSLARGLTVIRAFSDENPRQTISDIARRCALSRPAARRFLLTLVQLGYVATDGSQFWLTPQVLELGSSYLSSLSLPDLAQPHLTELSAGINESSSVAVLDGSDIVYVARVQVRRIMATTIVVGTRLAAPATAMGRVLLAGLPKAKRDKCLRTIPLVSYSSGTPASRDELAAELERVASQGFSIIDHQTDYGLRSVAAPILDRNKNTVAAVSVSAASMTYSAERVRSDLLPQVLATAEKISIDVAHTEIGLVNLPAGG